MAGGCIKNFFSGLGCVTFVVILAVVGWVFRAQIGDAYQSVTGTAPPALLGPDSVVGMPSADALAAAERKESSMLRGDAGYVRLTADEVASLVEARLDPVAREAIDSLRVILYRDRLALEGHIRLDVFGRELLGPLAGMLDASEPLRMGGTVAVAEPGALAWSCDEFVLLRFPLPQSVIPALVNRLTGGDDGTFHIPVPEPVGDVRLRPDGVTLYRRVE
jgi:hypothetical protein